LAEFAATAKIPQSADNKNAMVQYIISVLLVAKNNILPSEVSIHDSIITAINSSILFISFSFLN
jgi:hypothetical protein